jgi:hypothetical protein
MAFGRLCRVIAARMHAEKENFGDYEFKKSGACRAGVAGQEATLPSMIAAVRGPLGCGEVFPDGASMTSAASTI